MDSIEKAKACITPFIKSALERGAEGKEVPAKDVEATVDFFLAPPKDGTDVMAKLSLLSILQLEAADLRWANGMPETRINAKGKALKDQVLAKMLAKHMGVDEEEVEGR